MKVCFPVETNNGMDSKVFGHFGSAPMFVIVDVAAGNISTVINKDQHHAHGACSPLKALDGQEVQAIVVGGIGAGALGKLQGAGVRVFKSEAQSIRDNVGKFLDGELSEFVMSQCCGGHSSGGDSCAH